jgi:hypothetical protein
MIRRQIRVADQSTIELIDGLVIRVGRSVMNQTEMESMSGAEPGLGQPAIEATIDVAVNPADIDSADIDSADIDPADIELTGLESMGLDAAFEGFEFDEPDATVTTDCSDSIPGDATDRTASDWTIDIVPIEALAFDPAAIAAANRQDRAAAAAAPADNRILADLQAQNQKLLTQNDEILGWVGELERALEDAQAALQHQDEQAQRQDNQLVARADELLQAQERSQRFIQELENAQKLAQRQQILIETLTAQMEGAQERLAQMERECTLAQTRIQEQAQKLMQAEGSTRNLKSRLQRQQRYTLQFRAALEKCLEASVPQPIDNLTLGSPRIEPMEPIEALGDLLPKSKPVAPWSSRFELNMSDIEAIQREIQAVEDAETLGLTYEPAEGVIDELTDEPDEFPPMALREANAELDDILRQTADRIPSFDPDSDWAGADELSQDFDEAPTPELAASLAAGLATIGVGQAPAKVTQPKIADTTLDRNAANSDLANSLANSTPGIAPFDPAFTVFDAIAARLETQDASQRITPIVMPGKGLDATIVALSEPASEPAGGPEPGADVAETKPVDATSEANPKPIRLTEIDATDEQLLLDQILSRMTSTEPQPLSRPRTPAMAGLSSNDLSEDLATSLGLQADWPAPVVHPLRQKKKIGSMASINLPSFPKP